MFAWLKKFSVFPRDDLESELRKAPEQVGAQLKFETLYRDYARYGIVRAWT